jgi:hypothetical protein
MTIIDEGKLMIFLYDNPIPAFFETSLKDFALSKDLKMEMMSATQLVALALKINSLKSNLTENKRSQGIEADFEWKRWELSLFIWIALYYSFIHKKELLELVHSLQT